MQGMKPKSYILNATQIAAKLDRLAYEIVEKNSTAAAILLVSINENGAIIAEQLYQRIQKITTTLSAKCHTFNPEINGFLQANKGANLILIDDVCNTGRSLFNALKSMDTTGIEVIKCAVLIDRQHKNFPINCDYVGLTISTTIQEYIYVNMQGEQAAWLE
jgi:pyrimidine operon attenuation protein/uracil phosphoribosyltransferase